MSRPGRTQRIAVDETPLNAAEPNHRARLGWLLAMSRLHHPDESLQDGGRFARALGDAGLAASRSVVSRWESGLIPVSFDAVTAYEQVLGLEPGRICSIAGYLRSGWPDGRDRARPRLDPAGPDFGRRLDVLVEAAESGTASSVEWQELGWHLAAVPLAYLRADTWQALTRHLVRDLPRTIGIAYRQLSIAARDLAAVPRAQDPLVKAISSYISHPAVQVVNNPLDLLDHLPTREAARLVLDVLQRPENFRAYEMGVWLARRKAVRGVLTAGELADLQMLVLRSWRSDAALASEHLAELITDLPEGMRATLVSAAERAGRPRLGYLVEHGEAVEASRARSFADGLAAAVRAGAPQEPTYAGDELLPRLLRESLFHRTTERRHAAALVLCASPFATPTADVVLQRLSERDGPGWLRARLATLLRYVSDDSHRLRLLALVNDPDDAVAVPLLQTLGHLRLGVTSDGQLRRSLAPDWSPRERAKLYVLGMTGSTALEPLARSVTAPPWQRDAARWWLQQGKAIRG